MVRLTPTPSALACLSELQMTITAPTSTAARVARSTVVTEQGSLAAIVDCLCQTTFDL